jgi:hypothetical protein
VATTDFVVIPRGVTQDDAEVWIGAFGPPPPAGNYTLSVESPDGDPPQVKHLAGGWRRVIGDGEDTLHDFKKSVNLTAGHAYQATLTGPGGETLARAEFEALPAAVPPVGERPFTVLIGSCFYFENKASQLGPAVGRLRGLAFRPHLNLLLGDQVYLDPPRVSGPSLSTAALRRKLLRVYRETFAAPTSGLAQLVATAGNYFTADDHEFWNNYPHRALQVLDTLLGNREAWKTSATDLYRAVQAPSLPVQFDVPPLSFFVADTRADRQPDGKTLMKPQHLAALEDWVAGLTGPGVLLVGQPIFETRAGNWLSRLGRRVGDFGLPDFEQYARLAEALRRAPHSVLILTGDVHFGRVGRTRPRAADGVELVEVISSPMALVTPIAHTPIRREPAEFPPLPGAPRTSVSYEGPLAAIPDGGDRSHDHFLVLRFSRVGERVTVRIAVHLLTQSPAVEEFQGTPIVLS